MIQFSNKISRNMILPCQNTGRCNANPLYSTPVPLTSDVPWDSCQVAISLVSFQKYRPVGGASPVWHHCAIICVLLKILEFQHHHRDLTSKDPSPIYLTEAFCLSSRSRSNTESSIRLSMILLAQRNLTHSCLQRVILKQLMFIPLFTGLNFPEGCD